MKKCQICNSTNIKILVKKRETPFSVCSDFKYKIDFSLATCRECGFVFEILDRKFDEIANIVYNNYNIENQPFPYINNQLRLSIDHLSNIITKNSFKSILEIGSGRGDFLYTIKERFNYLDIVGIEPSKMDYYIPTINSFFEAEYINKFFDIVVCRFVLEHIAEPKKFIREISKISNHIYIEVPNIDFYLSSGMSEFSPEHINYFSKQSIKNLFRGFRVDVSISEETLRIFATKSKYRSNIKSEFKDRQILKYFRNIDKIVDLLSKKDKKIAFFGCSKMFLWCYYILDYNIKIDNIICIDDNPSSLYTIHHNIPIISFDKLENRDNYIYLISISNIEIAERISNRLSEYGLENYILWRNL